MMHKTWIALVAGLLFSSAALASPASELARRDYDRGDYDVALQKAKPLAESGDAMAQMLLGIMYAEGHGVQHDDKESWQWYWKAAVGGNTQAQLALVAIYRDGRGIPADAAMADYWQWKVAGKLEESEKAKLEAEIAHDATVSRKNKDAAPVINQAQCKMPDYVKSGYGYRASGELQILFMLSIDGSVLEASMPQGSNWSVLDHDILNSYAKTCTFTAARHDNKTVSGLYALRVNWAVEP